MLVELCIGEVAGFDLSVMDTYRWHPHIERINLSRSVTLLKDWQHPCMLSQHLRVPQKL